MDAIKKPDTLPLNIELMDTKKYVQQNFLHPVTSGLIKLPSSNLYNPDGLFSEELFGNIGSEERYSKEAYIALNSPIIHPKIFKLLIKISQLYQDIMSSRKMAYFDTTINDFVEVTSYTDEVEGQTGFAFFLSHLGDLELKDTGSLKRDADLELFEKYKDRRLLYQHIVIPAGLRDVSLDMNGGMQQNDINKLYTTLLAYTKSVPENTTSPIYDNVRYQVQLKAYEIYVFIHSILDGKKGVLKGQYGDRKITLGTRNVIIAAEYNASSPNDPKALKIDETKLGIYQTMKALLPITIYHIRTFMIEPIFTNNQNVLSIPLINPKTLELEYQEITNETRLEFTSSDGIEKLINNFENFGIRNKPITVYNKDNKPYYFCLVYDLGNSIIYFKSISDLRNLLENVDKTKIRPMCYSEMFYICTYMASYDKSVYITRYPVLEDGSSYPSRIHLCSTIPSRTIKLYNLLNVDASSGITFPEYPIFGNDFLDATMLSITKLAKLDADHDGDVTSNNAPFTKESLDEVNDYLDSPREYVTVEKGFRNDISQPMKMTLYNLTVRAPSRKS